MLAGVGVGSSWRRHQRGTGCSIRVRGDVNLDLDDVGERMNMGSLQMLGNNFKWISLKWEEGK